jgi:hypothetical protein
MIPHKTFCISDRIMIPGKFEKFVCSNSTFNYKLYNNNQELIIIKSPNESQQGLYGIGGHR